MQDGIPTGENISGAFKRESAAGPVRHPASRALNDGYERAPVPWFHRAFRDNVDLTQRKQAIGISVAAPARPSYKTTQRVKFLPERRHENIGGRAGQLGRSQRRAASVPIMPGRERDSKRVLRPVTPTQRSPVTG